MHFLVRNLVAGYRERIHRRGRATIASHLSALEKLDFFHSLYLGPTGHLCLEWRSHDNIFHSDAPAAIIVTRKGKVAGVVGFEIVGRTFLVRQLQGAPKANFHDGMRAEAYLLDCAEQIAVALKMQTFRIVDADTAIWFRRHDAPEVYPSEKALAHMRRNYMYPETVGFKKSFFWRLRRKTYVRSLAKTGTSKADAGQPGTPTSV